MSMTISQNWLNNKITPTEKNKSPTSRPQSNEVLLLVLLCLIKGSVICGDIHHFWLRVWWYTPFLTSLMVICTIWCSAPFLTLLGNTLFGDIHHFWHHYKNVDISTFIQNGYQFCSNSTKSFFKNVWLWTNMNPQKNAVIPTFWYGVIYGYIHHFWHVSNFFLLLNVFGTCNSCILFLHFYPFYCCNCYLYML